MLTILATIIFIITTVLGILFGWVILFDPTPTIWRVKDVVITILVYGGWFASTIYLFGLW